jgi:hypothetical protein
MTTGRPAGSKLLPASAYLLAAGRVRQAEMHAVRADRS